MCHVQLFIFGFFSEEEEEDPVTKAEDDFWHYVGQEKKDIENRNKKRQEAMMALNQPTPIPEEPAGNEPGNTEQTEEEKVYAIGISK